jgi:hypothetical protein
MLQGGIHNVAKTETAMSTLTYTDHSAAADAPVEALPARKSFWHRVYHGIIDAQQRRAEREIARFLASHGGLLTDNMERELMDRLSGKGKRPL